MKWVALAVCHRAYPHRRHHWGWRKFCTGGDYAPFACTGDDSLPPGRIPSDPPYWRCACGAVLDADEMTRAVHAAWHQVLGNSSPSATTTHEPASPLPQAKGQEPTP